MKTPAYESAQDWNRRHPPGTLVRVDLRGGDSFQAETAGYAQQWGALAILQLRDRGGLWTAGVLRPVSPELSTDRTRKPHSRSGCVDGSQLPDPEASPC